MANTTEQPPHSVWDQVKSWGPVVVVAAGLVGTGYVTLDRQAALAGEVEDLSESVDETEDAVIGIQLFLKERQGEIALDVQRIENEQKILSRDVEDVNRKIDGLNRNTDEILRLLQMGAQN